MMKYYYSLYGRSVMLMMIAFFFIALASGPVFGQSPVYEQGVFRIKVSEALAIQLEQTSFTKSSANVLLTGIQSLDNVNQRYKVSGIKRVFREAGKFEARHRKYGLHRWYEIDMDKASPVLEAISAYDALQQVEKAEPVYKKMIIGSQNKDFGPVVLKSPPTLATLPGPSNDPLLGGQWHYDNTGQTGGTPGSDISLFQAWGLSTGNDDVIVAVTDGGIQVNHPDLAANMWVNTDEIPGNNLDDDNNGYVDDINGYGFGDGTGNIAPDAHGTHVGGTIGAVTNNGVGVAGIAGGSGSGDGVRLMSCAAFGANGTGGFPDTYTYAADNGAVISQNSWGYIAPGPDIVEESLLEAIDYFIAEAGKDSDGNQVGPMNGGIVIFASGNSNSSADWYPGFYEPTLAVAGTTHQDRKGWYSNYGTWVDIAAPGGETNTVAQQGVLSTLSNNQYGFFQGTSMACPHVSGVAALVISKFGGPGFTPALLRTRLIQTVDNIDAAHPQFAGLLGAGRLNAFSALQENDNAPPEAIDDLAASDVFITSIELSWTAPADSGNGSATSYDIRYSTSPITEGNFASATPVANPPVPQPAGTAETFTVTDLSPGTTYYFAIKSADFFGNLSALSNVVEQATNFAPVVSVSPPALSDTLLTSETSIQVLTINNTGQGPLDFTLAGFGGEDDFATPSPVQGTVPAGGSLAVNVTFDASGLFSGTYQQELILLSNDPVQDTVNIPLTLIVINNGTPIASVEPDSIDFGGTFEGGSVSKPFTIRNEGSNTLIVSSIVSSHPDFTTNFTPPLNIAPFAEATVTATFTASSVAVVTGTLDIFTNDPADSVLTLFVRGEGLEAPDIVVTPDSLYEELNTGNTVTRLLTVQNTGASNLEFSVAVSEGVSRVASVRQVDLPSAGYTGGGTGEKQVPTAARKPAAQSITVKSVATSAVTISVLILTPDNDVSDLASILNSFEDVDAVIFPKASLPGITLSDLEAYDIVMTSNNTQWLMAGGIDPAAIGDLLADYIDQGGKVIVNQFAYSYDAWKMDGRFITEQYGPFTPSTTDANVSTSLGDILEPQHPVMEGVTTLGYSGFVQNVGLAPGATALAEWANGELFMAVNSDVVALNMLPSLGNGDPLQWTGDLPTIYQNAIHWLAGPSFVTVTPTEGTVTPGAQTDLEVTFDAAGLADGIHSASIDISTNVPGKELVSVPAVLNVLGPQFIVTPDSLYEALEKEETSSQTLTLHNNGTSEHSFSITVDNKGIASLKVKPQPTAKSAWRVAAPVVKRETAYKGPQPDVNATRALMGDQNAIRLAGPVQAATVQYTTDFETFAPGDISGQEGWAGQFGNWTIESANASSGDQHFRGLADGLGLSLAFSPVVTIGAEAKSTATMKLDLQGSGVTWQIIPQSPTAGLVNTRLEFSPDGSVRALVSDGAGGGFYQNIPATVPSGYFDLTIAIDRATSAFDVYFNEDKIFTGQGFAGNIEQVVVFSLMETGGPTLDIDDFAIIDGEHEIIPPYVTVSPLSGTLGAGESIDITVNFDATGLEFGTYLSDIIIDIEGVDQLTVPVTLDVVGDPAIEVDPTVLQATIDYKGDTTEVFTIENTGGALLHYNLQVIGADVDVNNLPASPVSKFTRGEAQLRVQEKQAKDDQLSRKATEKRAPVLQLLTGAELLQEDFEDASFPPSGWNVVDNEGSGVVWSFAGDFGEGNYCGTGEAATASSDAFGEAEFDTELITPSISVAGYGNIVVQYNANYQNFANLDFLDLDIQVDGSDAWTNVLRWNEDHGSLRGGPGEFVTIELDEYIGNATSFRLRWHYYDPNTDDFDWYAQIDDVVILGDPRSWLTVNPASGTIPVRGSADITAHFHGRDIEPGFYVAGILVSSNAVEDPLVGVVASLTVLEPAEIDVQPSSLSEELPTGHTSRQPLLISNSGPSSLRFSIGSPELPGGSGVPLQRKELTNKRTAPSPAMYKMDDTKALLRGPVRSAALELYATGFEEFATGDIDGQEGWGGQFSNWEISTDKPFEGAQHFRGLADALGQSAAFSPEVAIGSDPVSSTTMQINLDDAIGSTWQVIPQSPTAELVVTRISVAPSGALSALVQDSLGNAVFENIPVPLPSGYFELRIDVVRATSVFTLYFNGEAIFQGQGFAGDIEQVVIFSAMEEAGQVLDLDNLVILDGAPSIQWLSVDPETGIVPSGSTTTVTVTFDATQLEGGTYRDTLNIYSNDPDEAVTRIPVELVVNERPVLAAVGDTTVTERSSISLTFTATDADDAQVSISLRGAPSFVTLASSANGTATYNVQPMLGDAGEYALTVIATDTRGAVDSAAFVLTVKPYGVESFSLIDISNGAVLATFTDSVNVDVAYPGFQDLRIRANTNPPVVGSVSFTLDGTASNTTNVAPYLLNRLALQSLSQGDHTLLAESFTRSSRRGDRGKNQRAVITIINSASITAFDVIGTNGQYLKTLQEGDVINISDPAFRSFTMVANAASFNGIRSVRFYLNGSSYRFDNVAPYVLTGGPAGNHHPFRVAPGNYTLTAIPYSKANGGVEGVPYTVNFTITNGTATASSEGRISESAGDGSITIDVYPVSITEELIVEVAGDVKGEVELVLRNAQGMPLYHQRVQAEELRQYQINVAKLGLHNGVYYLQVSGANGLREVIRLVKK